MLAFLKKNNQYTADLKISCVEQYLQGKMSMEEIIVTYNISSDSVLQNWISCYNADRKLKDFNPKKEIYMAEARRKTTLEERKEIVKYCLEHARDYKETANNYDVSYNQVYTWVKKYDTKGEEGLLDKCKLEEKDKVVELLKKVKEFERK